MAGRSRTVTPRVEVLTISEGDTLTVKRRLTAGERRELVGRATIEKSNGERLVDGLLHRRSTVIAYLLDSTIPGLIDTRKEDSPYVTADALGSSLDALEDEDYREISVAIEAHEDRMDAERAKEKKERDGVGTSSATSPSPASTAGVLSGSVN